MNKIVLEAAPADESLDRVGLRFVVIALRHVSASQNGIAEIDVIADLHERSFFGDEPSETQWIKAREILARARALDLDLDLVLALALALALDVALDLDLALARALDLALDFDLALALARALDLALARALTDDLIVLLGDRLEPLKALDAQILQAVEVEKRFGLEMSSWHCGTTHCRSGSACFLHPLGKELERVFGNWLAGAVIYKKSTGVVPNFYANNKDAMADIRRCAAEQTAAALDNQNEGNQP
jgi:hypothetical protein